MINSPLVADVPERGRARPSRQHADRLSSALMLAMLGVGWAIPANAAETGPSTPPQRPTILFHRWQEDWSVLADPRLPREPFDALKYLPIAGPAGSYVSFGLDLRERFESNDAPDFGTGRQQADGYLLQRFRLHADLRLGSHVQVFTQIEDARTLDKTQIRPVDANRFDLSQAFVAITGNLDDGIYKVRAGRQEMGFDLQRFVGLRDGPNVRQAFDALWLDWERAPWRVITFASRPVQYRNERAFDDYSNGHLRFGGFRVERQQVGPGDLSAYIARYRRDNARYLTVAGNDIRDIVDLRYAGNQAGLDWDLEAMRQSGHVGATPIHAWATGARAGYTLDGLPWMPRLGLQLDAASGDRHPDDRRLGTFNPLFPNGYYFTLAGYTGYANLLHLKPSVTLHPNARLAATVALGMQWRQTVADAVYMQPNLPVPGTAGHGGHWTGSYAQLRLDYQVNRNITTDLEAVHYRIGNAIRQAGGRDGDYLELELKFGW